MAEDDKRGTGVISKIFERALKTVAIVFAHGVAFMGMLMAIGGLPWDVAFGTAVATGALVAIVGIVRSKPRGKAWRFYALLAAVALLLFGAVLPSARRASEKKTNRCASSQPRTSASPTPQSETRTANGGL